MTRALAEAVRNTRNAMEEHRIYIGITEWITNK